MIKLADDETKLRLLDLVDINLLQAFQDAFASALGVASITVDDSGPVTTPSNFTDFCIKYTRGTKNGLSRCNNCDISWGKIASEKGEPVIYDCHTGLTDFAVPIMVEGKHIASILGGQILTKEPDEEHFRAVAKQIGVDEDEYISALKKIRVVAPEYVKHAADLLFIAANAISKIAHRNLELINQNKRESLIRAIMETVRSSLDINETKQKIVDTLCSTIDADRCFIVDYDPESDKFLPIQHEYVSSSDILKFNSVDINTEVPNVATAIKNGKKLVVVNKEMFLDNERKHFEQEKSIIEKYNINSSFCFPLYYAGELLGAISIQYTREDRLISEGEIDLFNIVMEQVAIALYQAQLYQNSKIIAERESLSREIFQTIRSSTDIDKIKKNIVSEVGKALKADRCFIMDFDKENDKFLAVNYEYLSSSDIISYVGSDVNSDVPAFSEALKRGENVLITNKEIYLKGDNENFDSEKKAIERTEVKSAFAFPFYYAGELLGALGFHYVKEDHIMNSDESDFLSKVADQIAIAIFQARLYKITLENAEREKLIGSVISKAISTFDVKGIKHIVNEVGVKTKADRCYFVEVDLANMKGLPIDLDSEYLASPEIKSIVGYEFPTDDVRRFVEIFLSKKDLVIFDYEALMHEQDPQNSGINEYSRLFGLKSGIGIPFIYRDKLTAVLCIEYVKEKVFPSSDELDFLRILGNQIGMAYNQILQYQNIISIAERETLLRNITENIRSSLDIEQTLSFICEETAKLFDVQRSAITVFPNPSNYEDFIVRKEYKSSFVKGLSEAISFKKVAAYWGEKLIGTDEVFAIDNIQETNEPYYFKNTYASMGIKSLIGTSIRRGRDVWGTLVLSEYNVYRKWTEEEKKLLKTVANQVYLAINQAELFETVKKQADREGLLRNVIETVRSSLDIQEVKQKITSELGAIFEADRCYFRSYDKVKNLFLAPDVEYLSSPEIKSLIGVEPDQIGLKYFADEVKKRGKGFYPVIMNTELAKNSPLEDYMTSFNIKADYAVPIVNRQDELTWLVLHYSKEDPKFDLEIMKLLETIAYQLDIAFEQIRLYNIVKMTAEKETLLRQFIEAIRSSLSIDFVKHEMVLQIGKLLNADRVAFADFDNEQKNFFTSPDNEYRSSSEVKTFVGFDFASIPGFVDSIMSVHLSGEDIIFSDLDKYLDEKQLKDSPIANFYTEMGFASSMAINISYGEYFYGDLVVTFNNKREITDNDIEFIKTLANQTGIALHQASLFQKTQIQAEREKVGRNIVEILRSSLDKATIKRLFVKNVGKYFNADRVFFADFDAKNNMYLPVDKYSEYLSSPDEKSFIGYDWSSDSAREYIQPIIDKRELNIYSFEEYIEKNVKSPEFVALFRDANVKSSYNLPVLYQEKIMGYFCIEFTQNVRKLSDEDINRIRNMCTQIAIALYHAGLLVKAQEAVQFKSELIANISEEIIIQLNNIINLSQMLSTSELSYDEQLQCFISINKTAKLLLDIANEIVYISEIESEEFKLNRENFDSKELIISVVDSVREIAQDKNINIRLDIAKVDIFADKVMLVQILYKLLINAIKFTLPDGEITLRTYYEDNQLIFSIEDLKIGVDLEEQNKIFEKLRLIDSSYPRGQQGAGLGLSIVKKLIEFHDGSIHVEAVLGKGARFWFNLPNASLGNF